VPDTPDPTAPVGENAKRFFGCQLIQNFRCQALQCLFSRVAAGSRVATPVTSWLALLTAPAQLGPTAPWDKLISGD
jgi:hypothetical protein